MGTTPGESAEDLFRPPAKRPSAPRQTAQRSGHLRRPPTLQHHYACALSARGEALFARPVPNDEGAIRRLIDDAAAHGSAALVVDTTSSAAVLALGVAAEVGMMAITEIHSDQPQVRCGPHSLRCRRRSPTLLLWEAGSVSVCTAGR